MQGRGLDGLATKREGADWRTALKAQDDAPELAAQRRRQLLQKLDYENPNYHPPAPPPAGLLGPPTVRRRLLQKLDFENPNYHPPPPPPIPPSPPPSPPSPSSQSTVPWQGTLQGITSALGDDLSSFACLQASFDFKQSILPLQGTLQGITCVLGDTLDFSMVL